MMDFFKKFLGNKSQRDIKVIMPYVDTALEFYEEIRKLSNDELRDKTVQFKQRIAGQVRKKRSMNSRSSSIPMRSRLTKKKNSTPSLINWRRRVMN
jgi:hypothetical protein